MRNRRKRETNRHVKKYNRVKIFGNIVYWACIVATISYMIYTFFLELLYEEEQLAQFPLTEKWLIPIFCFIPLISVSEYFYEKLLRIRAEKVLKHRKERTEFRKLHM